MDENGAVFVASTMKFLINLTVKGTNTVITDQLKEQITELKTDIEEKDKELHQQIEIHEQS